MFAALTLHLLCCPHLRVQAGAAKQVEVLQQAELQVRQLGQQLQQQVASDLGRQQQEVQALLARHSADVARDTIKQLRADQVRSGVVGSVYLLDGVLSLLSISREGSARHALWCAGDAE